MKTSEKLDLPKELFKAAKEAEKEEKHPEIESDSESEK